MHWPTLADDFSSHSTLAFAPFHPLLSRYAPCLASKSRVLKLLRTLFLSLRSFRRPPRLFSTACGLFVQNTGGVGASVTSPLAPLSFAFFLSPLCFHGLTNCFSRNPFLLRNICVAPRVWGPRSSPNSLHRFQQQSSAPPPREISFYRKRVLSSSPSRGIYVR
jgi:hypothetical protein